MIDFGRFSHLTFDCYGTLIDWETGILNAVTPLLARHRIAAEPAEVLALYARHEAAAEAGPYRPYREVLCATLRALAAELGCEPAADELDVLPNSLGRWPPFPDTIESLRWLKARYRLVILSNIDDDLFAGTARQLQVQFDAVITAQQVRSYKPALVHFRTALDRLGASPRQLLHVAQSLYHDHAPAKRLGFTTVRVNRPSRLAGTGVSLPAEARPDFEVPDLWSLVELIQRH